MAENGENQDLMGYEALAQDALRGVIRAALKRAAGPGLPGAHHLYISFKTHAAGVSIPPDLVAKYPDEMTIVLQHKFWDLAPGETFFSITLQFGGAPKKLSIPYAAVTRFYDPSVQFLLQFEATAGEPPAQVATSEVLALRPRAEPATIREDEAPQAEPPAPDAPKIVSLDQFRKK